MYPVGREILLSASSEAAAASASSEGSVKGSHFLPFCFFELRLPVDAAEDIDASDVICVVVPCIRFRYSTAPFFSKLLSADVVVVNQINAVYKDSKRRIPACNAKSKYDELKSRSSMRRNRRRDGTQMIACCLVGSRNN